LLIPFLPEPDIWVVNSTLGRILLALLVALGVTNAGAATAAECGDGISLACTGLVPPAAPEPEPEPEPAPEPEPQPEPERSPDPEPGSAPKPEPASASQGTTDGQAVDRLRSLMDADRRSRNLGTLASRSALSEIAVAHSRSMAERGELRHNDDLFTPATKARLGLRLVGENVASNVSIDDAHRRLMASAGHRANLLSASFVQVGIGVARAGNTWFITEVFATPVAPGAAARPAGPAGGAGPTAARAPLASSPGPAATDVAPPSPTAPESPGVGSVVAVGLEVAAPSSVVPSSPASDRRVAVRPGASWVAVLVAALLLLGVATASVRVPSMRSMLTTQNSAVLSTFRTWTNRPRLLRAVVGLRPRRLGAP
jgi:uncharacterized protein YkwD